MDNSRSIEERRVIACDVNGQPIRSVGLLEAHRGDGILHKAFSVLVFRHAGRELLLQQRSAAKPLFARRWANTCCSHPFPDEALDSAAARRLREEMGFSVPLRPVGSFVYRARDPHSDFSEYEHDTVFVGEAADEVCISVDPAEVADWRWMPLADLDRALQSVADEYAPWLPQALRTARPSID